MRDTTGTIDRLYLLNGGLAVTPDRSMYTPGRWANERVELCCHAALIRRDGEWILWDTGIDDDIANDLGGRVIAHGIRGIVIRSLERQLNDIGIRFADIATVILSHAHFDHVGNAKRLGHSNWVLHRREFDAMFGEDYADHGYSPALYEHLREATVRLADGDLDLFGDDSVRLLATPGHTPGHCSLLVRLARTGPVVLSADVAHDRYNLDHRCVPPMNSDAQASRLSMDRLEAIVAQERAELWLNHDIVQAAGLLHAPAFYD